MKKRKTKIKRASYVIAKVLHTWFTKLKQIVITDHAWPSQNNVMSVNTSVSEIETVTALALNSFFLRQLSS